MNLEKLSPSSAIAILESLLQSDIITEADVARAVTLNPSNEMKRVTDLVHSSLCHDRHGPDIGLCQYYNEETQDVPFTCHIHQHWLKETTQLMSELGIFSEGDLVRAFSNAQPLLQLVAELENKEPAALALALRILGWSV